MSDSNLLARPAAVRVPPGRGGSSWFYRPPQAPGAGFRLYCFPYAGGSATMFRKWTEWAPAEIEIAGILLPGRGARIAEPPVSDLDALADSIARAIVAETHPEFGFFGHSMGAILAFEVARRLRRAGARQPRHLFLSAADAPHLRIGRQPVGEMSEAAFIAYVRELNGTPEAVLRDEALLQLILPGLKADFVALDRWAFRADRPLDVPITAVCGRSDPRATVPAVRSWEAHTRAGFDFRLFDGDHFFIHQQEAAILEMIERTLRAENVIY